MSDRLKKKQSPPAELFSDGFKVNPYPTFETLRRNAPIYQMDTGVWIATRHKDVLCVLTDDRFSRDYDRTTTSSYGEEALDFYTTRLMKQWLVNLEGQPHAVMRKYMNKALMVSSKNIEAFIEASVEKLLNQCLQEEQIDLVSGLTFPLSAMVICEVLGIPDEDRHMFVEDSIFPGPGLFDVVEISPEGERAIEQKSKVVVDYLHTLCESKMHSPPDDFTGVLLNFMQEEKQVTLDGIVANLFFMFFAGHQSTQNLLSNCILSLYTNKHQLYELIDNPELVENAAEELVRFDTSVQTGNLHYAEEDVELSGVVLRKGEGIIPFLGSANRDENLNENAHELILERIKPKHLTFNRGPHFCIGSRLAMLEVKGMLRGLIELAPDLALEPGTHDYISTFTLRGPTSIVVTN